MPAPTIAHEICSRGDLCHLLAECENGGCTISSATRVRQEVAVATELHRTQTRGSGDCWLRSFDRSTSAVLMPFDRYMSAVLMSCDRYMSAMLMSFDRYMSERKW